MFEKRSDIHETFASYELEDVAASVERHLAPALALVPAAAPDAAATPGASGSAARRIFQRISHGRSARRIPMAPRLRISLPAAARIFAISSRRRPRFISWPRSISWRLPAPAC